ncbi:hypothetical protein JAAARDRAFT_176965 [Jaapia argillacea MUCL 33604]|uniref:Uncharacterized protein n=1 Tax=Jaapia argillacea MUCL 33604 TaxID=933084 RepID=A0A067Q5K7_9AGAM|nr:hypothetical protein JAAARDRAFT_176965 [Jaapia argillacea MUCL 33604]
MSDCSCEHTPVGKGKQRAASPALSERTPLLGSPSYTGNEDDVETRVRTRRRLWPALLLVFFISLCLCIFIFLLVCAYEYRSKATNISPEDVIERGLHVVGPDRVEVLNITEDGGIWVQVDGRVGVDAGAVMGVNTDEDDGYWTKVKKSLGRWGIRSMGEVSVNVSEILISPVHDKSTILASIETSDLEIPLTVNPPRNLAWLTNLSMPVLLRPTQNASALMEFGRESWGDGTINVQASVEHLLVQGGALGESTWRRRLRIDRANVLMSIRKKIPPLPGLPQPGTNTPFPSPSELITLQSFNVTSSNHTLSLTANASVVNPLPLNLPLDLSVPQLPFIVSLPSPIPNSNASTQIATVQTHPFALTHPNVTLYISGTVLPLPSNASPLLSAFLTRYLDGQPNPILVHTPLFPTFILEAEFPAPKPKPRILKNVTIKDMKIKPYGQTILASGVVFARVVLPKGVKVELDVNRVWPDVLVFDGEVPDDDALISSTPQSGDPSLPDPIPEGAFAHIKPDDWLPALSVPVDPEDDEEGAVFAVSAKIVDIPLEVLPGRQTEFSKFVSKVIFEGGALAGVQGVAAVSVRVHGLPIRNGSDFDNEMELSGLPFRGAVKIGKKSRIHFPRT